jgi:hypothetical protein
VTSTDHAVEQTCGGLGHALGPPAGPETWRPAEPPPARPPDDVRLARLIALAGLTPAQALEIGAGLLAALAGRSEPVGAGLDVDQVMVDTDGRVVLGRPPCGGPAERSSAAGPAFAPVETVLTKVADAARERARRPDPLLAELEQAVALLPRAETSVVARTLEDACAAIDRAGVRAELSALVRAIVGGSTVIVVGGASATAGADRRPPLEPAPSDRRGRAMGRRIGAWLLSVAVVVAVVLLEVAFLRDDIAADVDLLLDAGRSGSAPAAVPAEPDGIPLVPPAPAAAGAVRAVDLRAFGPCAPGVPCTMRFLVQLDPGAEPQTVTWAIRVVDRCTGVAETVPGGSVVVPPGAEQAAVVGPVALPHTAAAAVLAVTDQPAAAASPPVLVGSCPPSRPAD